jgi:hypothetical protein
MARHTITNYPIGATWEANYNGKTYWITLNSRSPYFEVWYAGSCINIHDKLCFSKSDWYTSYQNARRWLTYNDPKIKFKRISIGENKDGT